MCIHHSVFGSAMISNIDFSNTWAPRGVNHLAVYPHKACSFSPVLQALEAGAGSELIQRVFSQIRELSKRVTKLEISESWLRQPRFPFVFCI